MKKLITGVAAIIIFATAQQTKAQYWSKTGNAGTDTSINFLGTTDNKPFQIRTNNLKRMTISNGGYVGIGTVTPASKLDVKSTSGTTGANFYLNVSSSANVNGINAFAHNSGTGGAFGGNFTATGNSSTGTVAAVSAYAQSGLYNYGFFGSVLTSGSQSGYGVFGSAIGSGYNWGGYFEGDDIGVEGTGSWIGGKFNGDIGISVTGKSVGGRFSGTYNGMEVKLSTATNSGAFPQSGIDCEVQNTANTDQVFGVYSYVNGKSAKSNVIGVYSEPHATASPFLTSFYGVGNVNITGSYYSSSDKKLKQNIKPMQSMLDKIMQLAPSTYEYRTEEYKMNLPKGNQFGLIAQDLQKVFPELVAEQVKPGIFDKQTNEKISDEVSYLGVNYTGLIPVIISAMQDLKKENITLKDENIQLKKEFAEIKAALHLTSSSTPASTSLKATQLLNKETINASAANLEQNAPNPFKLTTIINYYIPEIKGSAAIDIISSTGQVLKTYPVTKKGNGQLSINAGILASGTYYYVLKVDNVQIASKQMLLVK